MDAGITGVNARAMLGGGTTNELSETSSPLGECPPPLIRRYDPSLNFTKSTQFALSGELLFSGIAFTGTARFTCSGDWTSPCEPNLYMNAMPVSVSRKEPRTQSFELLPLYETIKAPRCDYSGMLERWHAAYPDYPVKVERNGVPPNPQGFYAYFGTLKRGPLLEIHHPFFNNTRQIPTRSISKSFAAAIILALQDQGKLSIDDPIIKYINTLNVSQHMESITLRDIMTHSSGFRDKNSLLGKMTDDPRISLLDSSNILIQNGLSYEPRTRSIYASGPFQIVGAVAEASTGKTWNVLWEEMVAGPLGMHDTYFHSDSSRHEVRNPSNPYIGRKSLSTANDLIKFMSMLANKGVSNDGKRVLSEKSVETITKWSGFSPYGTVGDRSADIKNPCLPETRGDTEAQKALDEFNFTSTGISRQVANRLREYKCLGLDAEISMRTQKFSQPGVYGLGVFVDYDRKCRKYVTGNSAFSSVWSILDFDGSDPILALYFGGTSLYHVKYSDFGRAIILLADEELQQNQQLPKLVWISQTGTWTQWPLRILILVFLSIGLLFLYQIVK